MRVAYLSADVLKKKPSISLGRVAFTIRVKLRAHEGSSKIFSVDWRVERGRRYKPVDYSRTYNRVGGDYRAGGELSVCMRRGSF